MKVNDGEILSILQIILSKNIDRSILNYCMDSWPLHNPLHTVVLQLTTIVIHWVE